jgi:hypothetical protein
MSLEFPVVGLERKQDTRPRTTRTRRNSNPNMQVATSKLPSKEDIDLELRQQCSVASYQFPVKSKLENPKPKTASAVLPGYTTTPLEPIIYHIMVLYG